MQNVQENMQNLEKYVRTYVANMQKYVAYMRIFARGII